MKLHIGCFNVLLDGWHNTDITEHLWIARIPGLARLLYVLGIIDRVRYEEHRKGLFANVHYLNASKKFPFPDGSVDAIYSSHMLVNFSREDGRRCIDECYRVLKPGGIFRIAVPDLDQWVQNYDPNNPDVTLELFFLPSIKRRKNKIGWMYNEYSLKALLAKAGFKNIARYEMFSGQCPDIERIDYRTDSIFFEGTKTN